MAPRKKIAQTVLTEGKFYTISAANGKVVEATWSRSSESSPTHYYDRSGNEIVLNQGKTWICCIWDDYAQYMSWE